MKQSDLTPEQVLPTLAAVEHVERDLSILFGAHASYSVGVLPMTHTLPFVQSLPIRRRDCIAMAKRHNYAIPVFPETELILKGER